MSSTWGATDQGDAFAMSLAPSTQAITPSKLVAKDAASFIVKDSPVEDLDEKREVWLHELSAWNFAHMLASGSDAISEAYHAALQVAAQGGSMADALEQKLEAIGWNTVDEAFFEYLNRRDSKVWSLPIAEMASSPVAVREATEPELLLLWAEMGGTRYDQVPLDARQLRDRAASLDSQASLAGDVSRGPE